MTISILIPLFIPHPLPSLSPSLPSQTQTYRYTNVFKAISDHPLFTDPSYQRIFLQTDWGRTPRLFRNLFPAIPAPTTSSDLLSLSTTSTASIRLITGTHPGPYTLSHSPLPNKLLQTLPQKNWTLLVDSANYHIPSLNSLLPPFTFLPNWRLDDIMLSYATPGGSVGPHVDNYDVFLIQCSGNRRWDISYTPIPPSQETLLDGCEVRVLRDAFTPDESWIVGPGDAVYVPARVPHHGVSLDSECMTASVGFRGVEIGELLHRWVDEVVRRDGLRGKFLQDCSKGLVLHAGEPGLVSEEAVGKAFEEVSKVGEGEGFARWFAGIVTEGSVGEGDDGDDGDDGWEEAVEEVLMGDGEMVVRQMEGTVFGYVMVDGMVVLFVNGEEWVVEGMTMRIAKTICESRCVNAETFSTLAKEEPAFRDMLERLFRENLLYIDDARQYQQEDQD